MLSRQLEYQIRSAQWAIAVEGPSPVRGEAIFNGGDYPQTWEQFIGQAVAVEHLQAAIGSAQARGTRLDHVLLASGMPGVGKSALAKLIAYSMGVGLVEISGVVTVDEARTALRGMSDGDILYYDEIHMAVSGGKAKAEWLLHLLVDGRLVTARGAEPMPNVTVVAATTDAQRLPATILSRFRIRPVLDHYSDRESLSIAEQLATRMGLDPQPSTKVLAEVTAASNGSPREMQTLLSALRDTRFHAGSYQVSLALRWAGVTADGLNRLAQDYLISLMVTCQGKAGLATLASILNEPGGLAQTEQTLLQHGFIVIESSGRKLTEAGAERTVALLRERGMLE